MNNKLLLSILVLITLVSYYVLSDKPVENLLQAKKLDDGTTLITYDKSRFIINIDKDYKFISVELGIWEGVTLGITETNSIKSILVNKLNKNGETQYIRDINADGIPDIRITHAKDQKIRKEYFYKGDFHQIISNPDGDDYFVVDGEKVSVKKLMESIANKN